MAGAGPMPKKRIVAVKQAVDYLTKPKLESTFYESSILPIPHFKEKVIADDQIPYLLQPGYLQNVKSPSQNIMLSKPHSKLGIIMITKLSAYWPRERKRERSKQE